MVNLLEYRIENQLQSLQLNNLNKEIVFFCVGNHKIWYDSFGPLFAEQLRKKNINCFVYGGTSLPILADNLVEYMDFVIEKHPGACVFVVDNCLSDKSTFDVTIKRNKVIPAALMNNIGFGDYSILLLTNHYSSYKKYLNFQNQVIITLIDKLQTRVFNLQKYSKNR